MAGWTSERSTGAMADWASERPTCVMAGWTALARREPDLAGNTRLRKGAPTSTQYLYAARVFSHVLHRTAGHGHRHFRSGRRQVKEP
eukprot:4233810-Alexandrium_andersonii.AAC.1